MSGENFEPIYSELFGLLKTIPNVETVGRRLKHWSDVPREEKPAIFLAQGPEDAVVITGQPTKWDLHPSIYVYVHVAADEKDGPAPHLNRVLGAIRAAIKPQNAVKGHTNTLDGLVEFCRIEGRIETDEGTLGEEAVAIIPLHIRVPN